MSRSIYAVCIAENKPSGCSLAILQKKEEKAKEKESWEACNDYPNGIVRV